MAQSGFTPIVLYHSDTTTNVPTTIVSGELAANTADGKLFLGTGTNTYKTLLNVGSSTVTVAGNVTFSGAFATTITVSGTTTVTLPTSGTLLTTAGSGSSLTFGTGSLSLAGNLTTSGAFATTITTTGTTTVTLPTSGTLVALGNANTFTGTQTFNGTSSTFAEVLLNAAETTTVSATAATGTINYYINSQSVLYYTSSASANWTLNIAFSSGTSLNTALATGQTVTIVFLVTQGATAYYNSAVTIDTVSVTPKWQGGTAPTAGNASGIDVYTYSITKTASATYTVLASQTQFK